MNYFIIGSCAVIGFILLVVIIKVIKKRQAARCFEEDIAWQLSKAREMGIPLDNVKFDDSGSLLDPSTGKPMLY
jgi:hypothetical protein